MNAIQNGLRTVEQYNEKFGLRQAFLDQLMSAMDTPVKGCPVDGIDTKKSSPVVEKSSPVVEKSSPVVEKSSPVAETGKVSRGMKRKAGPTSSKAKMEKKK